MDNQIECKLMEDICTKLLKRFASHDEEKSIKDAASKCLEEFWFSSIPGVTITQNDAEELYIPLSWKCHNMDNICTLLKLQKHLVCPPQSSELLQKRLKVMSAVSGLSADKSPLLQTFISNVRLS